MGHYISNIGIQVDNDKVEAIKKMRTPLNLDELKTFMGMVTYLGKFLPNLSKESEPLRCLEKK